MVSRELAVLNPEGFLGAHVLHLFSFPSGDPARWTASARRSTPRSGTCSGSSRVGGYNQMNGTRPQTDRRRRSRTRRSAVLAYSELFENFGNGTSLVRPEQVLAQATLYWLTNTYATAARYHFEEQRSGAEPVVSQGRHRGRRLQGRLPDDPGVRRAGQRQHRPLVGVPPRRSLRRDGGPGGRGLRPADVLRLTHARRSPSRLL